jgi:hypothetical protein
MILEAQHAEVEKELERQKQRLQGISQNSLELDLKRAEIDQAEAMIKMVPAEKERLRVELQATSQRVTQCQEAEVPTTKNVSSQIKQAAATGFWGFLLGAVGAVGVVCQEHLSRRVRGWGGLP